MKIIKGLALIGSLCAASPALADGVMLEANGARAQERWGGELGLGYTFDLGRFRVRPIGGAFIYGDENGRYRNDTISGGRTVCRDYSTGAFADKDRCNSVSVDWYGKAELTYVIPQGMEFGGGARFSADKVRGYGTVAFPIGGDLRLKGSIGDRYYAFGLKAQF
ncbi:hypothetical protein [Sphingomonas sanguinis]|nr:hypothetical protein [Sphingomonas sanguinis]